MRRWCVAAKLARCSVGGGGVGDRGSSQDQGYTRPMMVTAWSKEVSDVKVTWAKSGMNVGEALWMRDTGSVVLVGAALRLAAGGMFGAHAESVVPTMSTRSETALIHHASERPMRPLYG